MLRFNIMMKRLPLIHRQLFLRASKRPSSCLLHCWVRSPFVPGTDRSRNHHVEPILPAFPAHQHHRGSTQVTKESTEEFMERVDTLLKNGELQQVSDALNQREVTDISEFQDWQRSVTERLVEAYFQQQASLLDKFHHSFPSSLPLPGLYQVGFTNEQRRLLQEIAMCANEVHHSIERLEPLLSPKGIWLLDKGTDSQPTPTVVAVESPNPSIEPLAHLCSTLVQMWAKTMRASARGRSSEEFVRGVPQRIRFFMERMVHLGITPTLQDRNHAMESWVYSKEHMRASNAERIFEALPEVNAESHRWMVWAWALSRERRAAYRATGHLRRMFRALEDSEGSNEHAVYLGDMEPTLSDYHVVLKAWAKSE